MTTVLADEPVKTLTWDEAEALFPGCSAQWDAQMCQPIPDVVLFVNGLDSITAAWRNPIFAGFPQRFTLYAWWSVDQQRWAFE